jgi:hypothetical protein
MSRRPIRPHGPHDMHRQVVAECVDQPAQMLVHASGLETSIGEHRGDGTAKSRQCIARSHERERGRLDPGPEGQDDSSISSVVHYRRSAGNSGPSRGPPFDDEELKQESALDSGEFCG